MKLIKIKHFQISCLLFSFAVFFSLIKSHAQSHYNSPYSRFALGNNVSSALPLTFSLGGSALALSNSNFINTDNPASYTSFNATVFETGLHTSSNQIENINSKSNSSNTTLGYITFGIPLKKWWGMAFGIMPETKVEYNILEQKTIDYVGKIDTRLKGEGGINRTFLGTAFKIKNFSFGAHASYLFGSIDKERRIIYDQLTYAFYTKAIEHQRITDFKFDLGTQYKILMPQDWQLGLAGVYQFANNLNTQKENSITTYFPVNSNEINRDTIYYENTKGNTLLPSNYGFGMTLEKPNQISFNINYQAANWSQYRSFEKPDSLRNSQQLTIGCQFSPDKNSSKYWKIIQYRTGFRFANTPLYLNGNQLKEMALTMGFGIPIKKTYQEMNTDQGRIFKYLALLNIGIELGQRGSLENNLIKEKFINARIGITVNDKWFIKRKYD